MKRLLLSSSWLSQLCDSPGPAATGGFRCNQRRHRDRRAELHPTAQALAFMLKAPEDEALAAKKKMKLWATYYHMPTVRSVLDQRGGEAPAGQERQGRLPTPFDRRSARRSHAGLDLGLTTARTTVACSS